MPISPTNCKHSSTPGQINIIPHTKSLLTSVSTTLYNICEFRYKDYEACQKLRKKHMLKKKNNCQNYTQIWLKCWNLSDSEFKMTETNILKVVMEKINNLKD